MAKKKGLSAALFDDMFTRRLDEYLHPALSLLANALMQVGDRLTWVDFGDNAVNPTGAKNIGPLIENCLTLKVLALNNTGVGTLGGEVSAGLHNHVASHARGQARQLALGPRRCTHASLPSLPPQSIGNSLMAAYRRGQSTGKKYALETFILGRSRLENQGCVAIAKAFEVCASSPPRVCPRANPAAVGLHYCLL